MKKFLVFLLPLFMISCAGQPAFHLKISNSAYEETDNGSYLTEISIDGLKGVYDAKHIGDSTEDPVHKKFTLTEDEYKELLDIIKSKDLTKEVSENLEFGAVNGVRLVFDLEVDGAKYHSVFLGDRDSKFVNRSYYDAIGDIVYFVKTKANE